MAREFAKIKPSIWQDDDFRALPPTAQHLYFVVLTDPDLSYCGVADWRPKRIAPKASGWTVDDISAAGAILTDARLLVIDESTEEVLVRSFLRHDGVMAHNKLCVSAMNAFSAVASNTLRGVIVHELNRLKLEFPEWPAWGRQKVIEVLKRNSLAPGLAPSVAPGLGAGLAPGLAPEVAPTPAYGLANDLQQQQQQQHTTATEESNDSSSSRAPRATKRQVPEDYRPSDKAVEWQKANHPNVNVADETERFINHHRAKGSKFVDLDAAWRNWIKNAVKFAAENPRRLTAVPSGDDRWQTPAADFDERW